MVHPSWPRHHSWRRFSVSQASPRHHDRHRPVVSPRWAWTPRLHWSLHRGQSGLDLRFSFFPLLNWRRHESPKRAGPSWQSAPALRWFTALLRTATSASQWAPPLNATRRATLFALDGCDKVLQELRCHAKHSGAIHVRSAVRGCE